MPPSHDPEDDVTSELSDPEDRVRVEVDEAREVTEEEGRGLTTYLWASSSHSQGGVIRALSGHKISTDSLSYSESLLKTYLDTTFH